MRTTYGLLDLFTLVSKVLAPFVDPLRAEFATCTDQKSTQAIDRPRPSTPPQPQPAPVVPPVVRPVAESTVIPAEPATVMASVPVVADTLPAVACMTEVTTHMLAVDFTASVQIHTDPTSEAGIPASLVIGIPATLFVRKKTGGQWRYHPAREDAPGPKFRRLSAGRRVRYEPAR